MVSGVFGMADGRPGEAQCVVWLVGWDEGIRARTWAVYWALEVQFQGTKG